MDKVWATTVRTVVGGAGRIRWIVCFRHLGLVGIWRIHRSEEQLHPAQELPIRWRTQPVVTYLDTTTYNRSGMYQFIHAGLIGICAGQSAGRRMNRPDERRIIGPSNHRAGVGAGAIMRFIHTGGGIFEQVR